MSKNHPTTHSETVNPAKLYPEFPLFSHASGQWAKKIRGKRLVVDLGPEDFTALRKSMSKKWGPSRLGKSRDRIAING